MAKIYADLIRKGLKKIDDVPEKIREQVENILTADYISEQKITK